MSSNQGVVTTGGIARTVGVSFIVATVAGVISVVLLGPTLEDPDPIRTASAGSSAVTTGSLLELIMAAAILVIPVLLFPILKRHGAGYAIGYLVARSLEATLFVVGTTCLLSLLTLGEWLGTAGTAAPSGIHAVGIALVAAHEWTSLLGAQLVFGVTALILNYSLYRTGLVPRLLSVWGFAGALLIMAAGLLDMFGVIAAFSTVAILLYLPIAVQEMVFALWLIFKGFGPTALDPSQ